MDVQIKSCLEGARSAKGLAVIIDIINASSTIVECFEKGAREVIPVDSMQRAIEIKKAGDLICGEMKIVKRVDFYNSPHYVDESVRGKRVIIKTDAGTKGILGAKKAEEVVIGCFLNCSALLSYIKNKKPEKVTLVPMGDYGRRKNIEDEAFAAFFKDLLEKRTGEDFSRIRRSVERGSIRNLFRILFLKAVITESLRLDTSRKVPVLSGNRLIPKTVL